MTKIEDLKTIDHTFDWCFSTPYKGSMGSLSSDLVKLNSEIVEFKQLITSLKKDSDLPFAAHLDYTSKVEIPVSKLGPENPIRHFGEVLLFEDELGDKGYSKANVRFRVMDDCFFILLRSYVRVDHVLVRILDTRIYHEFDTNTIIRDF